MTEAPPRAVYWACVLACAFLVLLVSSAAAERGVFDRAAHATKAKKATGYRVTNSRSGKFLFQAKRVKPGRTALGKAVITNAGTKPFRTVTLTQDRVVRGGASSALQLQIYDGATKRCIYPAVKVKKGRKPPAACTSWGSWVAGAKVRKLKLLPIKGKVWRPREKHVLLVKFRLAPESPNADQNRTASFRLLWRATG